MAINATVDSTVYEGIEKITAGGKTVELSEVYAGSMNIAENGIYDVGGKAEVVVNVPTETTGGTEPTGSINITTNGTHDVTDYAQAVVNVPQTGYTADDICKGGVNNAGSIFYKAENVETSAEIIRPYAFAGLTMYKVTAPNATKLGERAFALCPNLTEVYAPEVTDFAGSEVFWKSGKLTKAYFPKVASMYFSYTGIFYGCSSLTEVNLDSCTSLASNTFENCKALQTISLPVAATGSNSSASAFFSGCTSLQNVNLPMWKDGRQNMFKGCTSLEEISLPALTGIGIAMFENCTSLKKADFGEGVTAVGQGQFKNCTALETVILRHNGVVTNNNKAFQYCTNGVTVYVHSAHLAEYQAASAWTSDTNVTLAAIEGSEYE